MGIRGLTGWIRWAAPETIRPPDWSSLKGKKIGIDILGFLYKTKSRGQCPLFYLANMIVRFKQLGIIPIMVFDGKPPSEKKTALRQRTEVRVKSETKLHNLENDIASKTISDYQRSIMELEASRLRKDTCYLTSEERDVSKQLFYACGVLSLNASGEADNVLAYFAKHGYIDAVISNDMDLLARGVERLYVPDLYTLPGDTTGWSCYSLSTLLSTVSLSYKQFVEMCVLMGCDYTVGQKCLPYRSAYWAIKYRGELLKTLEVLGVRDETPYYDAIKRLNGLFETEDTLMGEKQWTKLRAGPPDVEPVSLSVFREGPLKSLREPIYNALY
jgi:flap endonuclease-1